LVRPSTCPHFTRPRLAPDRVCQYAKKSKIVSDSWAAGAAGTANQPSVSGAITQVGKGSITIQPSSGQAVAVALNEATVVKVNGKVAAAADLKVGMRAIALVQNGQPATEVRAYMSPSTK